MFRYIKLFILILFIISSTCFVFASELTDIINPIKLTAGKPDTILISDLFYLDEYNITPISNKTLNAVYNKDNLTLSLISRPDFEGIITCDFSNENKVYSIPIYCKKIEKFKFSFKPEKKYKFISLFGSFNNWNRQELPMKDLNGKGKYEITIPLEAGRYEYKFYADGEEILDPQNKNVVANDIGGHNSVIIVPELHPEKIFLHKAEFKRGNTVSEFQFFLESGKKIKIKKSNLIVLLDNHRVKEKSISISGKEIKISIPIVELSTYKMLRIIVSKNGLNSNMQMVPLDKGLPANNNSRFSWYDGIIYSLLTDRFYDGDKSNDKPVMHDSLSWKANYMGGDFSGITKKINEGYFDSLGINTIWISPVNDNPDSAYREYPAPHRWFTGYHGYWPVSPNKVEEKFGTFDGLKLLVNTAHQHKIKVLLDFVSHHVHKDHPYFKDHRDWFGKLELPDGRLNLRLWDEYRLTTWFEPYMPSFDFVHSDEATNVVSDDAVWWLKQTGADGFRHDAVKHVPNKFWRTLTKKLKKEIEQNTGNHIYQIGETFGGYDLVSSYVNNGQLSAQFNFELYNSAQAVFIDPKRSFIDLNLEMKKTLDVYGSLHLMGNIMDSHDKNRYMAYADGDLDLSQWSAIEQGWDNPPEVDHPSSYEKAELYYAYMLSVPGIPVIYYGSEFGMTGASDPDNRRMMRFGNELDDNEKKMLGVVSKIVTRRTEHSALRYGDFYTLKADDNIYAYCRSDFNERIIIALNKSEESQTVELTLPANYKTQGAVNLIDNITYNAIGNKITLPLNPRGWMMLKLEEK
jgi:cyclomaltodextrinase / maltogenic alpha-amylase / neopullulanase